VDEAKGTSTEEVKPKASVALPGWSLAKKVIRIVVGVILILLGLFAAVTPLTPGSWLIVPGLELLGLRVLLRDKARAWAAARPQSRIRKAVARALGWDGLDAIKQKWRRRGDRPCA
jgi:protein-S-isoprenylcysteine O-methyltransferase Ste14